MLYLHQETNIELNWFDFRVAAIIVILSFLSLTVLSVLYYRNRNKFKTLWLCNLFLFLSLEFVYLLVSISSKVVNGEIPILK